MDKNKQASRAETKDEKFEEVRMRTMKYDNELERKSLLCLRCCGMPSEFVHHGRARSQIYQSSE